jgi:hypothetical protein
MLGLEGQGCCEGAHSPAQQVYSMLQSSLTQASAWNSSNLNDAPQWPTGVDRPDWRSFMISIFGLATVGALELPQPRLEQPEDPLAPEPPLAVQPQAPQQWGRDDAAPADGGPPKRRRGRPKKGEAGLAAARAKAAAAKAAQEDALELRSTGFGFARWWDPAAQLLQRPGTERQRDLAARRHGNSAAHSLAASSQGGGSDGGGAGSGDAAEGAESGDGAGAGGPGIKREALAAGAEAEGLCPAITVGGRSPGTVCARKGTHGGFCHLHARQQGRAKDGASTAMQSPASPPRAPPAGLASPAPFPHIDLLAALAASNPAAPLAACKPETAVPLPAAFAADGATAPPAASPAQAGISPKDPRLRARASPGSVQRRLLPVQAQEPAAAEGEAVPLPPPAAAAFDAAPPQPLA